MKTITRIFAMLTVIAAVIFMDACKGEKGDIGPQGTAGVAGVAGPQGNVGVAGPQGTANVIYGTWQDMSTSNLWYKLTSLSNAGVAYAGYGWGCDINAPITQDIMDKGQVFVYGKFAPSFADNRVYLLPNTFWGNWYTQVNILPNKVYLQTIYDQAKTVPTTYSPTSFLCIFRYIIIPGGVAGGRKANVDYSDYEAVKKAYNIPD